MKSLAEQFKYKTVWSKDDQEFVGLCEEFPSLSWLDPNEELALQGIKNLVRDVLEDMSEDELDKLKALRAAVLEGFDSLKHGIYLESDEEFEKFMDTLEKEE